MVEPGSMMSRRAGRIVIVLGFWIAGWVGPWAAGAIEVSPNQAKIEAALAQGRAAAATRTPPDRLYAWFGSSDDLEPRGFLVSKLVGLRVMASHFALRSAVPAAADIEQVVQDNLLLISILIFGDRPAFAVDSYMLMAQGARVIKPVRVRFDGEASPTSVWPGYPAYRAKVVAAFAYADFDPLAKTKVSVYPAGGEAISFDIDFSVID